MTYLDGVQMVRNYKNLKVHESEMFTKTNTVYRPISGLVKNSTETTLANVFSFIY